MGELLFGGAVPLPHGDPAHLDLVVGRSGDQAETDGPEDAAASHCLIFAANRRMGGGCSHVRDAVRNTVDV